jgi:hypothetical protein
MSNIFYSEVDKNLVKELNARGRAGKYDRSNAALNFMLGKISNARITAYIGNDSTTPVVEEYGTIGGETVRTGRYIPNGPDGFLTTAKYNTTSISFTAGDEAIAVSSGDLFDETRRVGPILTQLSVNVGDHSMGLLNKATVQLSIPNPSRDLEGMEATWFRPGRFVRIEILHPESALITKDPKSATPTDGKLTPDTLPNVDKLKERYPGWDIDKILNQISYMNKYQFEGLITSFDFSYNEHMQIDATLNLTGTSNVYTDISMLMASDSAETTKKFDTITIESNIPTTLTTPDVVAKAADKPNAQLYDAIDSIVKYNLDFIPNSTNTTAVVSLAIPNNITGSDFVNEKATDHFVLFGEPYPPLVNDTQYDSYETQKTAELKTIQTQIDYLSGLLALPSGSTDYPTASLDISNLQTQYTASQTIYTSVSSSNVAELSSTFYNKYITLGALVEIVNTYVVSKVAGSVQFSKIICDDILCLSNYLPEMVSCIPTEILFLPENDVDTTLENSEINQYGTLAFYNEAIINGKIHAANAAANNGTVARKWPGVYNRSSTDNTIIYPSRIFINMEFIQDTLNNLSANNTKNFTIKSFFAAISDRISYASGKSIEMKLVTHPVDESKLLFTDIKYIKSVDNVQREIKIPYSVPMLANHPNGTIVKSFTFSAKLPESAKNLSYVLNQGDEVTEEQIAPYLNYMYSSKDPDKINAAIKTYRDKHDAIITKLRNTRTQLALSPAEPEFRNALYKDLTEYLKYPSPSLRDSQQLVAPIFPFDASFKIDGINGFRYGDILTFDALPLRYRVNTVFSIIGITHTVTGDGQWETEVRCIMRPNIE